MLGPSASLGQHSLAVWYVSRSFYPRFCQDVTPFWLHVFGIVKQTTWCRYVFTCFGLWIYQMKTPATGLMFKSSQSCSHFEHAQNQNQNRISWFSWKTFLWTAMIIHYQFRSIWTWLKITRPFKCKFEGLAIHETCDQWVTQPQTGAFPFKILSPTTSGPQDLAWRFSSPKRWMKSPKRSRFGGEGWEIFFSQRGPEMKWIILIGACLNPGSRWEIEQNYFTKGI